MKNKLLAFVLFVNGCYLAKMFYTEELFLYILPRYSFLVLLPALLQIVFAFHIFANSALYQNIYKKVSRLNIIILLFPVLASLFFPPNMLSSYSAFQRGVQTNISDIKLRTKTNFNVDSKRRSYADWIQLMESSDSLSRYIGQDLEIQGFVLKDERLKENEFYIARFVMSCCTADARTVVIKVSYDASNELENDDWILLSGKWKNSREADLLEIDASRVEHKITPKNPYLN